MRRTGVVMTVLSAALLGLPAGAGADAAPAAVACAVRTLNLPGASASVTAVVDRNAFLGDSGGSGYLWRNGVTSTVPIRPDAVNSSGMILGSRSGTTSQEVARVPLGGGTPQYGGREIYTSGINDAGVAAVDYFTVGGLPGLVSHAMSWKPGDATPTRLSGPNVSGARAIDDLGYIVGFADGASRYALAWGPGGDIVLQLGPFAPTEPRIAFGDIDNGVAAAGRYPRSGEPDIVLVDVRTGAITPVPGTTGYGGERYEDGALLGWDPEDGYALWNDAQRYELTELPNTIPVRMRVNDMKVFGDTVVIAGTQDRQDFTHIPVVWECG